MAPWATGWFLAMKVYLPVAIVMLAGMMPAGAQAPLAIAPDAAVYVVGYLDVLPPSRKSAVTQLKQWRETCRREDGNLRCEAVERLERQNQYVLLETWKDQASFAAHDAAPSTRQFRDKLKPMLESPYDQRVHSGLSVLPPLTAPPGRVTYVVTHIDVVFPRKDDAVIMLTEMAEEGRKEAGNSRLEVLQDTNQENHFTVAEIWVNRKIFDAHVMTPRMILFREKLQPILGMLYDERLFKILE